MASLWQPRGGAAEGEGFNTTDLSFGLQPSTGSAGQEPTALRAIAFGIRSESADARDGKSD